MQRRTSDQSRRLRWLVARTLGTAARGATLTSVTERVSGRDRLAINLQFTRSYVKQQVDYVRALGDEVLASLAPRTQQLLGWYTRVVTDLDEYYVPSEDRLYRGGQG